MSLSAGSRIGSYEIVARLGSGGMGDVYRARDTKLNRQVAIKVLPDQLARDSARVRRLQREAQLLAALNHPQIAAIYGLEESNGTCALVMELVEGEDLKERLRRGPMPFDEAVPVARQIIDALEAAHREDIVHRDLKPANIKLRPDGTLKVLDFGLAKGLERDGPVAASDDSPTTTTYGALTEAGTLLGTAAYMSPEQARGKLVDKRADIWAFGCVLYEILTAHSAFPGETISDTIASVLQREPDWARLPAGTPAAIRRLLRRCLEKDPKRRLHDIADARLEFDDNAKDSPETSLVAPEGRSRSPGAAMAGLTILTLVAGGIAGWLLRPVESAPETRLEFSTPPTIDSSVAVSPDGRKVVFVGQSESKTQLWLRSLDASAAQPLPDTEHGSRPFWSPDGRSIGFFADVQLKRLDLGGGQARVLVSGVGVPIGGSWNRDGTILFADNPGGPIIRIPAAGGEPAPATKVERPQQRGHYSPQFLPDGRHFVFFVGASTPEGQGIYVGQLDTLEAKRLVAADGGAAYSPTGHLILVRGGKLIAQGFDADRLVLRGDPITIEESVSQVTVSVSPAGPIAYRSRPGDNGLRQLVWITRSGKETQRVVYAGNAALGPALSHDGRRIAVYSYVNSNMDIWTYEIARGAWDRITFDPGDDIYPLFSPRDDSIIFGGKRKEQGLNLYRRRLNAPPDKEEMVLASPDSKFPTDVSADGQFMLYDLRAPNGNPDIWAVPLTANATPFEVVRTSFSDRMGQFSPDGKWIAYQSDRTGRDEIYLRPFRGASIDVPVSINGGAQPRWNSNGKELFYVAADDRMMVVPIRRTPDNKSLEAGKPERLFLTNIGSTAILKYRQQYVVARDGQSFILNSVVDEGTASPIRVILNWRPGR